LKLKTRLHVKISEKGRDRVLRCFVPAPSALEK